MQLKSTYLLTYLLELIPVVSTLAPPGGQQQRTVEVHKTSHYRTQGWWRSTVVERRSLTGELSLSCARPASDG